MLKTEQLEEQIMKVLDANDVCAFGTIDGNRPKIRYMVLFHEGLTVYLATNSRTDKVDELRENANVFVLTGYDGTLSSEIVQMEATAKLCTDNHLKEKLWNDELSRWFEGPHDPDYIVLELNPTRIEYVKGESEPQVWQK
ncbi:pyridoxamine 5'-phosphate oxidase family protein [Paenibacillus elgii]|uniref:General stress protein n=1 Tax=Paenibacillus elgii TaxID=189691 RepID=A0A2T6G6U5_9BACL|nr:pyridoxamine 5'-phosphate oxidase family protein [Paenibacillus elgii]MCM3272419.1 pyridoxamine 5'-phosphate oxidase family protein [Paenibacillus elgii]NEN84285.1 pyridoxamine 5'-phosphate oxidase family protein [Paenibacillus elgii]PUA39871.1 general stress protein [Paenibacillus elgii]